MVWKNGESGFHGVEVFRKVASMAWKNGEIGFHGVEDLKNDDSQSRGGKKGGTETARRDADGGKGAARRPPRQTAT